MAQIPKLVPEIKQRWVEALRSGEYRQGFNKLCVIDSEDSDERLYCCLGVLCDLAVQDGVTRWNNDWQHQNQTFVSIETATALLPNSVIEWAFGRIPEPVKIGALTWVAEEPMVQEMFNGELDWESLATLNDSGKCNFSHIADLIEEQL